MRAGARKHSTYSTAGPDGDATFESVGGKTCDATPRTKLKQ